MKVDVVALAEHARTLNTLTGEIQSALDTKTTPQEQKPLTPQQRHQVGYDREQAVAKIENGQVTSTEPGKIGKKIKTRTGRQTST
ncbi:hypothetical protein JOF56_008507 [Kibdelosporangium banguiense]|uniref:Uncharacterized protein n=1 Tax=Kibdelosporangium banguiense TaxID=1365924 RepID=A0ABS4TUP0_9PSEU|nr:hypothetical protein [Kibdelosporangium banguiense]MBP2328122.1 hypothetical protein [Kibdelosporangium banguiense]